MAHESLKMVRGLPAVDVVDRQAPTTVVTGFPRIAAGGVAGDVDVILSPGEAHDPAVFRKGLPLRRLRLAQPVHQDRVVTHRVISKGVPIARAPAAVVKHLAVGV